MWAGILRERIRGAGLELADVFVQNELDFETISRSAEGLKARVDAAAAHGIQVSVEGHVGSCVDTPEKRAALPGSRRLSRQAAGQVQ